MSDLKAITLKHVEIGTVASMRDGSVKFTIYTAELKPSECGSLMQFHGKSAEIALIPRERGRSLK